MHRFFVFLIYNLLLPVVLIVGFPGFIIKGIRRGGLARNFFQRLGFYRPEVRERLGRERNLWIHAVSVGEVLVAAKLIRALREVEPDCNVVLSTTTTTGFSVAEKETAGDDGVTVIHNPVDLPFVSARALRLIRPERLILVEAEVWPNLVRQAKGRGVPVILVNARLSERSERRFRQFGFLTRPIFEMLDRVCVPFENDIERWEGLGVTRDRIELTGSVKFDEAESERPDAQIAELENWLKSQGIDTGTARILLAGSTHAGEEALIGQASLELRSRFPELVYVAVPRHAERARTVAAEVAEAGLQVVLKEPIRGLEQPGNESGIAEIEQPRCFLANTTGELRAWFHLAEVVVIGKSLIGRGGQNPAEPIMAGRPVVVGPHMNNFAALVASLVRNEGIRQLESEELEELTAALGGMLEDPETASDCAGKGREVIERHRGAIGRTVEQVLNS